MGLGLAVASVTLLAALAYGLAGFILLEHRDFGRTFSPENALLRALREFAQVGNPDLAPATPHGRWFLESLRTLGAIASVLSVVSLFRPVGYRFRTLPRERGHARAIVEHHACSPLDYFKLWPDKSYFFSKRDEAVVAYRTAWSVAISLGDPVGSVGELEATMQGFLQFCGERAWRVAFHQVGPDLLPAYRRCQLHVLKIGEEAIVNLDRFQAHTSGQRPFRKVRRRFEGEGYQVRRQVPPHPTSLIDKADDVSREWLSLPGRRERGFALGRFERTYVAATPLVTLEDASGHLVAFVNEVPAYRPATATVDLMRHRRDVPNGAMDYLFTMLFLMLHRDGFALFSLGLAPLAGVGEGPEATFQERAVHQVYEHLRRVFSFKGLRAYKAKFEPSWEDRYLIYQGGPRGLLRTAIALGRLTGRG